MSRLPHFLDSRLTDGGEDASFTRRLLPGRFLILISVKRLSRPQGHSAVGRIRSIDKSSDLIGNRTRDLPACSIVPQPTTLPRAPYSKIIILFIVTQQSETCRHCMALQLRVPLPALVMPKMWCGRDMTSRNTIHVLAIMIGGRSENGRNSCMILLISNICHTAPAFHCGDPG
jgi:hypothetical protein